MDMAEAAGGIGLLDLAVWLLTARNDGKGHSESCTEILRKRGNFSQAIALWARKQADPTDAEAQHKGKFGRQRDISRGKYDQTSLQKPSSKRSRRTPPADRNDATIAPPAIAWHARPPPLLAPHGQRADRPAALFAIGCVYNRAGRYDEARDTLQTAWGRRTFPTGIELMELDLEPFRATSPLPRKSSRHADH